MSIRRFDIQEAGRGGRDGSVAKAILIWSLEDSLNYSFYKKGSREAAMREFAETTKCRRQVLLDALGAEQAVCSGCDLCNARNENSNESGRKNIKYKNSFKSGLEMCDWQTVYSVIKKSKNYYSENDIEDEIFSRLNKKTRGVLGVNAWTHGETVDVVRQLKDSGKIELDNFLWKGRLRIKKIKKSS